MFVCTMTVYHITKKNIHWKYGWEKRCWKAWGEFGENVHRYIKYTFFSETLKWNSILCFFFIQSNEFKCSTWKYKCSYFLHLLNIVILFKMMFCLRNFFEKQNDLVVALMLKKNYNTVDVFACKCVCFTVSLDSAKYSCSESLWLYSFKVVVVVVVR